MERSVYAFPLPSPISSLELTMTREVLLTCTLLMGLSLGLADRSCAAEDAAAPSVPAPDGKLSKDAQPPVSNGGPQVDDPVIFWRLTLSEFKTPQGEEWLRRRLPAGAETDQVIAGFKSGALTLEAFKAKLEPLAAAARQERNTKERARIQAWVFDNLKQRLNCSDAEFEAMKPLLLHAWAMRRQQKSLAGLLPAGGDRSFNFDEDPPKADDYAEVEERMRFLGLGEMDPTAAELLNALRAFRTLAKDEQASPAELDLALGNLRKSRAAFQAALEKAQSELKSVLTRKQEVLLVECGLLD